MGNSQALAGNFGKGKIVAFGDSNGFTALIFTEADGSTLTTGLSADLRLETAGVKRPALALKRPN